MDEIFVGLMLELTAAHQIIKNGLACMTFEQKARWGQKNTADKIGGNSPNRADEREAILEEATEALFHGAKRPAGAGRAPTPPTYQMRPRPLMRPRM